jgi:hypothetical protein
MLPAQTPREQVRMAKRELALKHLIQDLQMADGLLGMAYVGEQFKMSEADVVCKIESGQWLGFSTPNGYVMPFFQFTKINPVTKENSISHIISCFGVASSILIISYLMEPFNNHQTIIDVINKGATELEMAEIKRDIGRLGKMGH